MKGKVVKINCDCGVSRSWPWPISSKFRCLLGVHVDFAVISH